MSGLSDVLVVTGGIGSGKSFASGLLEEVGWSVVDADDLGHRALESKKAEILTRWPLVQRDGVVDRRALAEVVFADAVELRELELITHPVIEEMIREWVGRSEFPMAVEASAPSFIRRLAENPTLVVDASVNRRRERAIARGMTPDDWESRLAVQPTRTEWLDHADFVFDNDSSFDEVRQAMASFDHFWRLR